VEPLGTDAAFAVTTESSRLSFERGSARLGLDRWIVVGPVHRVRVVVGWAGSGRCSAFDME